MKYERQEPEFCFYISYLHSTDNWLYITCFISEHIIFMRYKCILNYALNTECWSVVWTVMLDISIFLTRRGGGGSWAQCNLLWPQGPETIPSLLSLVADLLISALTKISLFWLQLCPAMRDLTLLLSLHSPATAKQTNLGNPLGRRE